MRWLSLAALLFAASSCLESEAPDGSLTCSNIPGRLCPSGYYCAPDRTCWRNGHLPKVLPDMARPFRFPPPDDLSVPVDNGDMSIPLDLAQPRDLTTFGD
jgi:hypothetical protein